MQNSNTLSWILLIILSLIWGSSFILIKKGLTVFSAPQTASIRVSAAFITLGLLAIPNLRKISLKRWRILIISGLTGIFVPAMLFSYGQMGLNSSLAGTLNALTPMFALLIGIQFFQQKFQINQALGILLGLVGAIILILSSSPTGLGTVNFHAFYIVSAAIMYGINVNLVKNYLSDMPPLYVTTFSLFVVGPLGIIFFFGTGVPHTMLHTPGSTWAFSYLFLLGMMSTAFALLLFNRLIQITSAVFASSVTYLIPIVAIFWGLLDGERFLFMHFVAISFIIGGVWLVNAKKIKASEKAKVVAD